MLKAIFPDGIDKITVYGLTQWDVGQQLQITLASLPSTFQVHFASKRDDVAYVVEGTSSDGVGTVNIPNILLQNPSDANAWIYIGNTDEAETIKTICLPITPRAKPSDYTYEETEILNYNTVIAKAQSYANAASLSASSAKTSENNASNYASAANEAKNYVEVIVAGNEAYTKYESSTQYGSVIVQKASGSDILIKDGSNAPVIDFKGYGKSEQTQYSGKNKLDVASSVDVSANGYVFLNKAIDLKAGVEYKLTFISSISQGPQTQFGMNYVDGTNENLSTLGTTAGQITKQTFTPTKDVVSVTYYSYNAMTVKNCMISLATEDDTYEPYVGATSSPNPSYPQRINAVGDKGFFDGELLQGYYEGSTGTFASNSTSVVGKNKIPCKGGDIIKLKYETETRLRIPFFKEDGTFISRADTEALADELECTAPTDASYFYPQVASVSDDVNLSVAQAKHISVTINGMYALIVKERNKNFLDIMESGKTTNTFSYTTYTNKYVKATAIATTKGAFISGYSAYLEKGKSYTFSQANASIGAVYIYKDKLWGTLITSIAVLDKPNYLHTAESGTYIIGYYTATVSGTEYSLIEPMLRLAEITDDTYVAHKEKTTHIPISAPLRSSLDGSVKDEVYKVDGKYVVERKYRGITTTASNLFLASENYDNVTYYGLSKMSDSAYFNNYKRYSGHLCNKFTDYNLAIDYHSADNVGKMGSMASVNSVWFGFPKGTTLEEAQAIGDIELQYLLATPTIEVLDQTPFYEMCTFDGVTHITSEAKMEVSYATDTKAYIDNKIAEIQAAILNLS